MLIDCNRQFSWSANSLYRLVYSEDGRWQRRGNDYYYGLIGSHTSAFDWYQNQWPRNDVERPEPHSCKNKQNLWAHHKNFNEDRPMLSAAKCRPMIVVSKNIRYMRIFAGRRRQIQYMLPYTCVQTTLCLCEIIPCVLLTYRVGVQCIEV